MAEDQYRGGGRAGAYTIETFKPGSKWCCGENDAWRSGRDGQLPFFKRVIDQTDSQNLTNRAKSDRKGGRCRDIATDLQAIDVLALQSRGKLRVDSTPQSNGFRGRVQPPGWHVRQRQGEAGHRRGAAYDSLLEAAIFKRGLPCSAHPGRSPDRRFRKPLPTRTDLDKPSKCLPKRVSPPRFTTRYDQRRLGGDHRTEAALIKEHWPTDQHRGTFKSCPTHR